jgi:histidinol-phosphate aminotransferase
MYIDENIQNLCRVKLRDARGAVLRLDMNENPGGLSAEFVESVKAKITPEYLATYPEKDRLALRVAEHNGVSPESLTVTGGSDEAMGLAFRCFGKPGSKLVTVTPTFEMYGVYAGMNGLLHRTVDYNEDFTLNVAALLDAIDDETSVVAMLNPNSPIGAVYTETEAKAIIEKARSVGAVVMIDEAYHYFYSKTFIPLAALYDNVLVLRTFSKICAIAGLRVGYAVGNPLLIDVLERAESTFNVNSVGILFAEEMLKHPRIIDEQRELEAEGRAWLTERLTDKGYKVLSLEGNFVLFKPYKPSGELVAALKERGIWTRDYGRGILAGYLRVSTGARPFMEQFWEALWATENVRGNAD